MAALARASLRGVRSSLVGSIRAAPVSATYLTSAKGRPQEHVVPDELIHANGGLLEYSVVYTDRALNHMSTTFCDVMKDLDAGLTRVYNTDNTVLIPGSGTYGMEAVARQYGEGRKVLVIRNGYFSYRWTQLFDTMAGKTDVTVMKAAPGADMQYRPPPIERVVETILREKPSLVCAPHVETSIGMILPRDYCMAVAAATKEVGGVFCLDGIASGNAWVNMNDGGPDVYLTAPQKGWTGPACAGIVMMTDRAKDIMKSGPPATSFSVNLDKWSDVMQSYLDGGFSYHTTMPTDALRDFRDVFMETEQVQGGFKAVESDCWALGNAVRKTFAEFGYTSVAADGFAAPGVVVVFAKDAKYAARFKAKGLQIAAGVPFMLDEPEDTMTYRIGLFGLDKMQNVDVTVAKFKQVLTEIEEEVAAGMS